MAYLGISKGVTANFYPHFILLFLENIVSFVM